MKEYLNRLLDRIETGEAKIAVVGLGYVGLPLAIAFAERGFQVLGFDTDYHKLDMLKRGESYLSHIEPEEFKILIAEKRLVPVNSYADLVECDVFIVCVPTPLTCNREPDLSAIETAACGLKQCLGPSRLFILESSTYPGTTRNIFARLLTAGTARIAGKDVFIAHSPERQDPGNQKFKTHNVPRVVGGVTPFCLEAAIRLYKKIIEKVVPVETTDTAEMVKLFENTYRMVNIALINELKMLCHRLGINVWSVVEAAATKPFGFQSFKPGPGLGGHCIPIDPFYLTWKAREVDMATRFIELAGEINSSMPYYVVERLVLALEGHKKSLRDASILVLGVAYKANVNDARESPAIKILRILTERNARAIYHDPYIADISFGKDEFLFRMASVPLTSETIANADAVLVLTDHTDIDYARIGKLSRLVVDTRNVVTLKNNSTNYFPA